MKHCTLIPTKHQKAMYVGGVESGVCGFYATLHTELLNLLLMSKGSKVYSVYSGLSPLPRGKAIV